MLIHHAVELLPVGWDASGDDSQRCDTLAPMTREELLHRLATLKPWLASQGVTRVRLFGSHARDQAGRDSDVDLIVNLTHPMGLRLFSLQDEISARLGVRVDLVTEAALAPDIRYTALRDAVDA